LLYSVPFIYCVGHSRFTYCLIGAVRLVWRDRRARQYGMSELYWMVFDEHGWIQCCSANRIRQLMHKRVNARFALVNPFQAESPIMHGYGLDGTHVVGYGTIGRDGTDAYESSITRILPHGRPLVVRNWLWIMHARQPDVPARQYCLFTVEIVVRECTIYDSRA